MLPMLNFLLRPFHLESIMDEIELTIRLIMNHKEACQVIGRDGSNIKTLRDETGSKIVLSSREYKNRILSITDQKKQVMKGFYLATIYGNKTIISAVKRLSEILESEVNSYGASTRLVPISLTLVIPKNIGGLIVGQGGKNIKDLRVNSGAQIIFSAEEQFKILLMTPLKILDIDSSNILQLKLNWILNSKQVFTQL